MKKHVATYLIILLTVLACKAEIPDYKVITVEKPNSAYGVITRYEIFSQNLDDYITVDVWTPSDYNTNNEEGYPVIYMHDGQNLFDPAYSYANVAWEVDKAITELSENQGYLKPIVVGINNRRAKNLRANDYFPEKALNYIENKENTFIYQTCNNNFLGDEEAAFVVSELKPLIDALYHINPSKTHTFAMGSSMGALASLYLLCEYPDIFGGAACLSTHWIGSLNLNPDYTINDDQVCANAIIEYVNNHIPSAQDHILYLDQGSEGWDAGYIKYENIIRDIVRAKGYNDASGNLYTYDAVGAGHNEWYWQQRAKIPLKFLLSKIQSGSGIVEDNIANNETTFMQCPIFDLHGNIYNESEIDFLKPGIYIYRGKKYLISR